MQVLLGDEDFALDGPFFLAEGTFEILFASDLGGVERVLGLDDK
ncbi:MAG: hypothetical protein U0894_00580 [Pirellulales bacterium]